MKGSIKGQSSILLKLWIIIYLREIWWHLTLHSNPLSNKNTDLDGHARCAHQDAFPLCHFHGPAIAAAAAELPSCICLLWPHQAPLSTGFPKQEYRSGLPFSLPGDLPDPGWNEGPSWQPDPLPLSRLGSPSTPSRRKQKQAKSKAGSWNTGGGGGHKLVSQKTAHFRHMNVFKVLIIAYTPRDPLKRERPIHTAAEGEDLDDLGLWSQGCRPFPSPQPRLPLRNCWSDQRWASNPPKAAVLAIWHLAINYTDQIYSLTMLK